MKPLSKCGASDAKRNNPELAPDVWVLPHTTPNLAEKGAKAGMFATEERAPEKPVTKRSTTDEPLNESPTAEGLMAEESTSERPVAENPDPATLRPDDFSHEQSIVVKLDEGIELAYTGHCTGERAFKILQEELGEDVIKATKSGLRIELDE